MKIVSNQGVVIATEVEKEKDEIPKMIKVNQSDLANITFQSMMDKMQIASLEEISAALTFDVMQFKMGGNL